jgi:hypothetical protein
VVKELKRKALKPLTLELPMRSPQLQCLVGSQCCAPSFLCVQRSSVSRHQEKLLTQTEAITS